MSFYSTVFEGNFEQTKNYLAENFTDCRWNCPTGEEDLEGIIDALSIEPETILEVDYSGNIRCKGDMEVFASIADD